jgi:hypothetical protein
MNATTVLLHLERDKLQNSKIIINIRQKRKITWIAEVAMLTTVNQLPGYIPCTYTFISVIKISHLTITRLKTAQQIDIPQMINSVFCVTCTTETLFGRFRLV